MFREFLTSSELLHWPVIAMMIFFIVFLAAVIYALSGPRKSRALSRMAALPLDDEDLSANKEVRS
ncbi:MAG: hypothetical protein KC729_14335 [Candidatus Eisenbacteria bacterium]|uniref:Cbb3-type cytochrome c oxidase subunit 3 n=1 Tax=Eiseniibacteriota bacterium TaxID=2212470 RepID=A0A956LZZ7_UNCEI|nr:hypothetical protein [Candidatus Eisenbacteria bacterium]